MLAGRKLLLADDSATIQKVIDLTFADEGVRVVSVSNGQEAIDRLPEVAPDIVLADVLMPERNGYEVCEYVKTSELFKHIPVMLLVGSFEPFDEAEARRVGADDILTKPFQSIRRLIERVGALVSSPPPVKKESPTLELPRAEKPAEEELMDTHELEVTTADTLQLSEDALKESLRREENMETVNRDFTDSKSDSQADSGDVLLDLGDIEAVGEPAEDEFVLELDDEVEPAPAYSSAPTYEAAPAYEPVPARAFVEPRVVESKPYETEIHDSFADTQEVSYAISEPEPQPAPSASSVSSVDQLSPEMIDAIARRAVELMSDKVIREIAWEVVPDLAELLIKKQLEETK